MEVIIYYIYHKMMYLPYSPVIILLLSHRLFFLLHVECKTDIQVVYTYVWLQLYLVLLYWYLMYACFGTLWRKLSLINYFTLKMLTLAFYCLSRFLD